MGTCDASANGWPASPAKGGTERIPRAGKLSPAGQRRIGRGVCRSALARMESERLSTQQQHNSAPSGKRE